MKKIFVLALACLVLVGCSHKSLSLGSDTSSEHTNTEDMLSNVTEDEATLSDEDVELSDKDIETLHAKANLEAEKLIDDIFKDLPKRETVSTDNTLDFNMYLKEYYTSKKLEDIKSLLATRYNVDVKVEKNVFRYDDDSLHYAGTLYSGETKDNSIYLKFSMSKDTLLKFAFGIKDKEKYKNHLSELKSVMMDISKIMLDKDISSIMPAEVEVGMWGKHWEDRIDEKYTIEILGEDTSVIRLTDDNDGFLATNDLPYAFYNNTDVKTNVDINNIVSEIKSINNIHKISDLTTLKKMLGNKFYLVFLDGCFQLVGDNIKLTECIESASAEYNAKMNFEFDYNDYGYKEQLKENMEKMFVKKIFPNETFNKLYELSDRGIKTYADVSCGFNDCDFKAMITVYNWYNR